MKELRACKNCHYLSKNDRCPLCSEQTLKRWTGYVIIREPKKSQIAKKMNITKPGKYALKVK